MQAKLKLSSFKANTIFFSTYQWHGITAS